MRHRFLQPYARILAPDRAWRFSVAGWFARLSRATNGIAIVLLVSSRTDGYALAGAVAGAVVVGVGISTPLWARAVDRRGQLAVLPWALVATTLSSALLLAVILLDAPVWTWFAGAFVVGATWLEAGALTRGRWVARLDDPAERHTAFAVEGVLDELSFVVGPPLVTLIATLVDPALGFAVGTALSLLGGIGLLLQHSTAPAVAAPNLNARGGRGRSWMPRGVAGILPVFLGVGAIFGGIDLVAVGIAEADGVPALAGVILATFAVGSVAAGIVFGPLSGAWHPLRRVVVAGVALAAVLPVLLFGTSAGLLAGLVVTAGLATSPVLIASSSYVASIVDRAALTTAMAWPTVALAIGVTVGAVVAGVVIDAAGPHAGLLVCVAAGVEVGIAAALVAVLSRARTQNPTVAGGADGRIL